MLILGLILLAPFHAVATSEIDAACSHSTPCPLQGGLSLPRCPELRSKDGFLDIVLTMEIAYFQFEWLHMPRRSFNGTKCPPTLRIKPGDIVNLTLINKLENGTHVPGADLDLNITNLHTHGLHISSEEPQDNVFVKIRPGQSYQYSYQILDYHAPGTNWYHPHFHRATTMQTVGGMAGMLIVEDDPNSMSPGLRAVSCPENCQHDIPLMVSPMLVMFYYQLFQTGLRDSLKLSGDLERWLGQNVNNFTVNGEFLPVITLEMDQLTRFRILNVGQLAPLELLIVDGDENIAPCDFREIARDGVYYDKPVAPKGGQSVVHPGNRLDWLIKCTEIGTFKLYSLAKPQNEMSFGGGLRRTSGIATLNVTERISTAAVLDFPASLPARPVEYLSDLRNVTPDQYITVEIGGSAAMNRDLWTEETNYRILFYDSSAVAYLCISLTRIQVVCPSKPVSRFKVEVDSVIEIQMLSADYDFSHPMHVHVNHMQVIGFEPYTGPVAYYDAFVNPTWEFRDLDGDVCYYQHSNYVEGAVMQQFNITNPLNYAGAYERWVRNGNDTLAYDISGQWVDTVFSPALSNITLRMKTDRFTGPLLIHCHIPSDADRGMMMVIEVVEKGANISDANILSGGAAPGSCQKCDWNRFMEMPVNCSSPISAMPSRSISLITTLLAMIMT